MLSLRTKAPDGGAPRPLQTFDYPPGPEPVSLCAQSCSDQSPSQPVQYQQQLRFAPANFEKEAKEGATEAKAFNVTDYLAKVVEKLTKEGADVRVIHAIEGAQKLAAGPVVVVRNQKPLPTAAEKAAAPKRAAKKADPMQAPAANGIAA